MIDSGSTFPGSKAVYLDTGVVTAAMLPGALHHRSTQDFCQALVDASSTVIFSNLLYVEFLQSLVSIGNDPGQLSGQVRRRFRLHRWGDIDSVRLDWLQHGVGLLQRFLDQFAMVTEAEISPGIVVDAIPLMARYKLRSYDALHIATAQALGISHFATCDADFLRVEGDALMTVHLIRDAPPSLLAGTR